MSVEPVIRESKREDSTAIESLYRIAFPDEDLVSLVRDLVNVPDVALSLVATVDMQIVAHVIFTKCGVAGNTANVALLAPLAVDPAWQRQGIGSAIVRAGLRQLEDAGVSLVCVLGDPNYYGRLGFAPETLIEPPYSLPPEWHGAWQSIISGGATEHPAGVLSVPPEWRKRALWAP